MWVELRDLRAIRPREVDAVLPMAEDPAMGMTSRFRRKRVLIPVATVVGFVVVCAVLVQTDLVVPVVGGGGASMSPTLSRL